MTNTPLYRITWMEALMTALAFAIPCAKRAVPTIITLVVITALVQAIRNRRIEMPLHILPNLFLAGIFMLLITGLTYSAHPDIGLNEIGIKLSFLIFPLLSFLLPTITHAQFKRYSLGFVIGCFIFMLITVVRGAWRSCETRDLYCMSYESLSWYMHPTYAATYQALAIFLLVDMGLRKEFLFGRRMLHLGGITACLIFIAMLSSKAGLISAMLALTTAAIVALRNKLPTLQIALGFAFACAILIGTTAILPTSSQRISSVISDVKGKQQQAPSQENEVSYSSTKLRLVTWSAAWHLMNTHPFGVGTGATSKAMNAIYLQEGETYAAKRNFNAHNQFLQLGAELGWPAVLLLFACLISLWLRDTGQHHSMLALFIALCGMNFLFESFLEVQAGIVFFSFWILLFTKSKSE